MRLNRLLVAMSAAGLMAMVGPAQASITFQFNPLGNGLGLGLINGAGLLDQAPGNTYAINGSGSGAVLAVGTTIHDLYQANLGSVQALDTSNLFGNGAGGNFFTFVAAFSETVVGATTIPTLDGFKLTNDFTLNGGGTFKMCAKSAIGNNLTGVGFGCANPILTGSINGGDSSQTATFHFVGGVPVFGNLDQAGGNDWPGVTTLASVGSADILATISFVNSLYFPDLKIGYKVGINSSLVTPYKQVDPSRRVSSGLVTDDTVTNVGTVNGFTGSNFLFQSDANNSFDAPEPGALALGGIALAGLALLRSRRKQSV